MHFTTCPINLTRCEHRNMSLITCTIKAENAVTHKFMIIMLLLSSVVHGYLAIIMSVCAGPAAAYI
jgi:hypothetical protein